MKNAVLRKILIVVLTISMTGCSFGPRMQTIQVSSEPTGADVIVNSNRVGKTPLQ